jgi:RHS repeat-associated protein
VHPSSRIDYAMRWPGHRLDATLGLFYNRFRDYDPSLARYLQTDPIGQRGGINVYAYCNNPLKSVDLLGLAGTHDQHTPNPAPDGDAASTTAHRHTEAPLDAARAPTPLVHPSENPANPSPTRLAELDEAQRLRAEAVSRAADLPDSLDHKTVAVNGGEHLSGYDTTTSRAPSGFESSGRDPRTNLAYENSIGHTSPANTSVDPRVTSDGDVVGARGSGSSLAGGAAATHAERQSVIAQNSAGTNDPIGVSREQCGDCRREFRAHAANESRPGYPAPVVVGDPAHTRVYQADGSVDIYRNNPDGSHGYVRTAPSTEAPTATIARYRGIDW